MPEASVDKDHHPLGRKRQIRTTTRKPGQGLVDAVPKSTSVEELPQSDLGIGVARPLARHPRRSRRISRCTYTQHTSRLTNSASIRARRASMSVVPAIFILWVSALGRFRQPRSECSTYLVVPGGLAKASRRPQIASKPFVQLRVI